MAHLVPENITSGGSYSCLSQDGVPWSILEPGIELSDRLSIYELPSKATTISEHPEEVHCAQRHLLPKEEEQHAEPRPQWRLSGWRVGAIISAATAFLSLLVNIVVTIWCSRQDPFQGAQAILFSGDCARVASMNLWIHLGINALSTALLSGSNYCMQCLCAPNRKEVQKAHAAKQWLDIGVPSTRNLRHIQSRKVLLWWCLALSSVPLHLLYNSVFFSSLATNSYNVLYTTPDFAEGGAYDTEKWPGDDMCDVPLIHREAASWQRLDNAACIRTYANDLLSQYRNVVLVVSNETAINNALLDIIGYNNQMATRLKNGLNRDPYNWICNDRYLEYKIGLEGASYGAAGPRMCYNEVPKLEAIADQWSSNGYSIEYCLAERVPETCNLNFSRDIAIVVMTFNFVKILCMCYVAFWIRDRPLITVGDAVDSFLRVVDESSKGLCLLDQEQVMIAWEQSAWAAYGGHKQDLGCERSTFRLERHRWANAASARRWAAASLLIIAALVIIGSFTGYGISQLDGRKDTKSLWALGFGTAHAQSLIKGWSLPSLGKSSFIAAVLIANFPQPILSFIYFFVNGLVTSMLLADEWSDFAYDRKTLRVSSPRAGQRSTYFLQLPYRYALPLMVVSGLLHWLVSQSIFVADITINDRAGNIDPAASVSTCGYSPFAMAFTLLAGGLLLAIITGLGLRKYRPGMPLAATCSVAIAAACHAPDKEREQSAAMPLKWGAIPAETDSETAIRHCCFSSGPVEMPIEGREYA